MADRQDLEARVTDLRDREARVKDLRDLEAGVANLRDLEAEVAGLRNLEAGIVVPHKLNVGLRQILTDDLAALVAAGVVPLALNDRHAGLLPQAARRREAVGLGQSLGPGQSPFVDAAHGDAVHHAVGGEHLDEGGCPEPAVDVERLVVGRLATRHLIQ